MEIDKFFENYNQPKVTYSELKEKNKCTFNEIYSDIQSLKLNKFRKLKLCLYPIVLLVVVFFGIIYVVNFTNQGGVDYAKIIEEINYISNMNTSDEKMVRIMNLEKEIRKLSNEEKNNVKNIALFYSEVKKTSLELKENVSWSEFLNINDDYLILSDFVNIENINKIRFIKGFSSIDFYIEKNEIINDIINIIDVPYIDVISLSNNDVNIHDILISGSTEVYDYFIEITDNFYINVSVYSNGYVMMYVMENNINKSYISIVKVEFNELKNICKYENLWNG